MRYSDLDELIKRVTTYAAACPAPLAERHIIGKAIELCSRAAIWRDTDEITFNASDRCEYVCTVQAASIVRIEKALFDRQMLTAVTPAWLDGQYPDWDMSDKAGSARPLYYTQLQPDTVMPYPRKAGKLQLRLVLKPAMDADVLPDFIISQYGSMIADAAAGQVLITPNIDFSNPQLGSSLLQQFEERVSHQAYKSQRTQMNARMRTKPHNF